MPQFAVEVHPLAAGEAEAAERWYRQRNETAAARFRRELDSAVERIAERPEAGAPYLENCRRILCTAFRSSSSTVFVRLESSSWLLLTRDDGQVTGASVSPEGLSMMSSQNPLKEGCPD